MDIQQLEYYFHTKKCTQAIFSGKNNEVYEQDCGSS